MSVTMLKEKTYAVLNIINLSGSITTDELISKQKVNILKNFSLQFM